MRLAFSHMIHNNEGMRDTEEIRIRETIVDGIFYPENPSRLRDDVTDLLTANIPDTECTGVLVPHAAFTFSGKYAGAGIAALSRTPDVETIVILAPVHRDPSDGVFLPESGFFRTPLGTVPVDTDLVDELAECSTKVSINDIPHLDEHCIEVILPFVQVQFPSAKIVPILLGKPTQSAVKALASALNIVFTDRQEATRFIVSSNLTGTFMPDEAIQQADHFLSLISEGSWDELAPLLLADEISACGAACAGALFLGLSKILDFKPEIIADSRSEAPGHVEKQVIYAALNLCRRKQ